MGSAHCPTEVTFDQSLEKILPGVKEILSEYEIQGSNPSLNCDLDFE